MSGLELALACAFGFGSKASEWMWSWMGFGMGSGQIFIQGTLVRVRGHLHEKLDSLHRPPRIWFLLLRGHVPEICETV